MPVFGEVADVANGLLCLAEGNSVEAALAFAAVVPIAGAAVTGAKFTRNAAKAVRASRTVARIETGISATAAAGRAGIDNITRFGRQGTEALEGGVRNASKPAGATADAGANARRAEPQRATQTAFRGPSQAAPGGQVGPPVSLRQVKMDLGRANMSVADYDIVHVPQILDGVGRPAFGATSIIGGKPTISISDLGLSSRSEAVGTIFHEIAHARSFLRTGHGGTESAAAEFGQRMLQRFLGRS